MKRLLGGLACALALAGCASDPYYYGSYDYGHGYYAAPSYDYGTPYYYYDYGYPYYGYPSIGGGLSLYYYDDDRNDHRWHDRGRWRDRGDDGRRWRGDDRNDDRPPTGNVGRAAPSDFGGTRGGPVMSNPVPLGQLPNAQGR
jgi:hypothetical protein